jgi:hypothetical protein
VGFHQNFPDVYHAEVWSTKARLQNAIRVRYASFISTGLQVLHVQFARFINPGGLVSLAPGFSPVLHGRGIRSRFNGFSARLEAAEAAEMTWPSCVTGLKPGANERKTAATNFENTP